MSSTDRRTDGQTDRRTRWIQYTPPPTSLGGGIINNWFFTRVAWWWNLFNSKPDALVITDKPWVCYLVFGSIQEVVNNLTTARRWRHASKSINADISATSGWSIRYNRYSDRVLLSYGVKHPCNIPEGQFSQRKFFSSGIIEILLISKLINQFTIYMIWKQTRGRN